MIAQNIRTEIYNQNVLLVITYGAQTSTLTKHKITKSQVTQRAMERVMIGMFLSDKKRMNCENKCYRNSKKSIECAYDGHVGLLNDRR